MICNQTCIHRKKKGKNIYCMVNNEKEILVPYKIELVFGEIPPELNKYMDMKRSKKCVKN